MRALLLALCAGAVVLGLALGRHREGAAGGAGGTAYVCPMHLEVRSNAPGECPICGMALARPGTFSRDVADDGIVAAELLSRAAGGVSPHLVGYYPSPLRQHVLRYEIFAPAWLETAGVIAALVYTDQVPSLEPAEAATFAPTARPAEVLNVRASARPIERWDRSMSLVRFDAGANALPAGTVGWVTFARRPRPMQVIPAAAVLESDAGPYALVVAGPRGTVSKRSIEVGRIATGMAAVLSGLNLREQVVSVNAFFWDAERRLQAAGGAP